MPLDDGLKPRESIRNQAPWHFTFWALERARRKSIANLVAVTMMALCGLGTHQAFAQDPTSGKRLVQKIVPPFAWNRTDRYEAPDYEGFFPNDVEAGKQLDDCLEGKVQVADVDARLALIRRGLRNTTHHRTTLLGSVGNEFIWNKDPQDPRAIELLYHASDSTEPEVAHYALYHGPTVVAQRTPNLVRMLMQKYQTLDTGMQGRIAWGMKTYGDKEGMRQLLLDLLEEHEKLDPATIGATLDTYQAVFQTAVPEPSRFNKVGKWVIAFHRIDLSAAHPRAAKILRDALDHVSLRNQHLQLIDFVTRVDDGHETAVALVQGRGSRTILTAYLSERVNYRIDFDEMLSPRTLQERRLRELARHLPEGLPPRAMPSYTRPPEGAVYAHRADQFVAPNFQEFFADDADAGKELDRVFAARALIALSDRELLELFRRGVRRSDHPANAMFGWISGALGWPCDPLLTEILYQAMDVEAPLGVRDAGIYYGFGLGTSKTKNVLEAMFRVYMTPPFDRTTNGNLRSRILWGVRDHEDDKYYLATRFEDVLRDHSSLSDEAVLQADLAYRQLTDTEPPNAAAYGSRGLFLVMFVDPSSRTVEESKQRLASRLDDSPHLVEMKFIERDGRVHMLAVVRGMAGRTWLVDELQKEPKMSVTFADLLTRELVDQSKNDVLRDFERFLSVPK